jgi:co-chaperonin GroES (HSP10)
MIQLEPAHDRVVIKRTEEAEETRSGLFIPDTAKEKPQQGEVVAVEQAARLAAEWFKEHLQAQPRTSAASGR